MSNTNTSVLYPEFWAMSFDAIDKGQYNLQNLVSRKYENVIGKAGDVVNVPVAPSFAAQTWAPGDAITTQDVASSTVPITLNNSYSVPFTLNGQEDSLSQYDLITEWGVPALEAMLEQFNLSLYLELTKTSNFINALSGIDEDDIADAGTLLSTNKVGKDRSLVAGPAAMGAMRKLDAFQHMNVTGTNDVMRDGVIGRRMGFDFYENNVISTYTPADLTGAVHTGGGTTGDTSLVVDGFNDDANPIRVGDIFTIATETGTPYHTVTAVTYTTGDTTGISFTPALASNVSDSDAIAVTASNSVLCFAPNAVALAARAYKPVRSNLGVDTQVFLYQGMPIRISIFHDGKLGTVVQYDALWGHAVVNASRIVRILNTAS